MRLWLLIVAFAAATVYAVPVCHADEVKTREQITDTFAKLFTKGDFKRLTAISNHYIRAKARTSSGLWKITQFDLAIETMAQKATAGPAGEAYLDGLESKAMKWMAEYPNSPSAYVDYAILLVAHAMAYQKWLVKHNVQYANGFENKIHLAMNTLTQHKKIASIDPQYYAEVVDIARIGDLSPAIVDSALGEGSKRYPYYAQLYFMTLWFLEPQFRNSNINVLRNFADYVVSKTRKKAGTGLYARLYWAVADNSYANAAFADTDKRKQKLVQAMEDVLHLYPDQWNIQHFAYFSCINGEKAETKRLIKRMHGKLISDAWANKDVFNQCRSWAYGSGS